MKAPKYVLKLLDRRAKLATQLNDVDYELSQWLEKNGITDSLEDYDYRGGVEIYVNPYASKDRIIQAIEKQFQSDRDVWHELLCNAVKEHGGEWTRRMYDVSDEEVNAIEREVMEGRLYEEDSNVV